MVHLCLLCRACVLNVSVSFYKSCYSDLYVVVTWRPKDDNDKLVSDSLIPKPFELTKIPLLVDILGTILPVGPSILNAQTFVNASNNLVVGSIDKPVPVLIPFNSDNGDNLLVALILNYSRS